MPKIVHIALKVKDLDKASSFYQQIFGFQPVRTEDVRDHTSRHLTDGVIDLSLMQYEGESPEALLSGRGPCIHHFGIEVEDLQSAAAGLKAAGCEILSPPGEVPVKFRDPNGVVAELVPPGRYK
jgi:lactoylglutathione lyase